MAKVVNDNRGRTPVKFKINQAENSKRVLDSGKLQFPNLWKYKEFGWMIKYLAKLQVPEEEIYLKFKQIHEGNFGDIYDEIEMGKKYNKIKSFIMDEKDLFVGSSIIYYKEEVEFINSLFGPLWLKQYFLVLLGYFKFLNCGNKSISILEIPRNTLIKYFTSLKKQGEHETQMIYDFASKYGLWEVNGNGKISLTFSKNSGEKILELNTSADLFRICEFVKNEITCPVCGTKFEYSSKSKRKLCLICWKKKDKLKRNKIMRDKYNSEKEFLFTI